MSNKYLAHLQVLPEDDANRELVNGLEQNLDLDPRRLQVLPPARGWAHVLQRLTEPSLVPELTRYPQRHLLLLIDFDAQVELRTQRYQDHKAMLPPTVADRIYLLGSRETPERLQAACQRRHKEQLGLQLSEDCAPAPAANLWQHPHLQHNAAELARLVAQVKPFLFTASP